MSEHISSLNLLAFSFTRENENRWYKLLIIIKEEKSTILSAHELHTESYDKLGMQSKQHKKSKFKTELENFSRQQSYLNQETFHAAIKKYNSNIQVR